MSFIGVLLAVSAALAGCAPNTSGNTSCACAALAVRGATPPPGWGGTVFTIVMENKDRDQIIGNRHAPFINQLARGNALAAGYHGPYVHPSEPNYLWMVAGQNFGVLDDYDPSVHPLVSTSHLADQLELAGLSWRAYQESMGAPCGLDSHGRYAAKHDPFVYFADINGWDGTAFRPSPRCTEHVVDYSQLATDLARHTVPRYVFITPNLDHDMHDGSIAEGDRWLEHEVPKILASDAYRHGGVLFLLWDEGGGTIAGDEPPFLAISPNARPGYVSTTPYSTTSFLRTVQRLLGVDELPCDGAADAAPMTDLFTVPM